MNPIAPFARRMALVALAGVLGCQESGPARDAGADLPSPALDLASAGDLRTQPDQWAPSVPTG